TLIWAGWGKLDGQIVVKGEDAANLAQWGVIEPPVTPGPGAKPAEPAQESKETSVRRMWGVAPEVHKAAQPDTGLVPAVLGQPPFPRAIAIGVMLAELGGGILITIGWLTRLAALVITAVMAGVIWLDQ